MSKTLCADYIQLTGSQFLWSYSSLRNAGYVVYGDQVVSGLCQHSCSSSDKLENN